MMLVVVCIDDFFATVRIFKTRNITTLWIGIAMKKYYKDYKLVTKTLPNGKVKQVAEYIGKYYTTSLSKTDLKRMKFYYLALVLCSSATAMGAGFLNNPGSRMVYVALPYVSLFLPIAYSLMGTIGFISSKEKLTQASYEKTKVRIHRATIWQILLSSITVLGDIAFVQFRIDKKLLEKELAFIGCIVFVLLLNVLFIQFQKRVVYQVEDPYYKE